jgi:hypothetical protein
VVLAENSSGKHGQHSAAVGAFVMPNTTIDSGTPLTAFTVPLEALESVAGEKRGGRGQLCSLERLQKKKKRHAGLVEQPEKRHGLFYSPSLCKLREKLLRLGKPSLVGYTRRHGFKKYHHYSSNNMQVWTSS